MTEKGRDEDPVYRCVTRLQDERQRQEDGRLLYVAVTRARRRVHLIGHAELDDKTGEARAPDQELAAGAAVAGAGTGVPRRGPASVAERRNPYGEWRQQDVPRPRGRGRG